ncbi:MAG: winged helix-turn-helix transcriptional regulator [Puniceicoccales bacterium]|nr:winged helix-turn-helix transcriptional regulator [Puniceicoccales bacterium]
MIETLRDNPTTTIKVLANLLGLPHKGIEWNLRKLKKQNIIRHVGPNKGGYWEEKPFDRGND